MIQQCISTGVPVTKVSENNITEFYKTTSNYRLNESFFARFLILVEGETEELALPGYLLAYDIDCDRHGVSIIAVQGKNQIPKYWRLFSLYKMPILVIFDNDNENSEKIKSNENISICFGLSTSEVTEDINIYKLSRSKNMPRTSLVILEKDFENALSKDFSSQFPMEAQRIQQWNNEARQAIKPIGNQNKGQIARYIARKIHVDFPQYMPSFVDEIAKLIKSSLKLECTYPNSIF